MKDILNYVPGFRSDVKWKKIVAIVYYLWTLFTIMAGLDFFMFFLAAPILVFSIGSLIKGKRNNKPITAFVVVLVVSFAGIFGSLASIGNATPSAETMKELEQPSDIELAEEDIEKKDEPEVEPEAENEVVPDEEDLEPEETKKEDFEEVQELKVHYLDVGQGDSILIQLPNGEAMLIDGGTRSKGKIVLNYLNNLGISTIDYVVATHPHEDHIGGLIEVINKHNIGKIYMPKVTHTTNAFEDLVLAIKGKDKKMTAAKAGDRIIDKEGLILEIVAPEDNCSDSNLNNHSVVVRLDYKNNSFLFTGDAEKESESKMVSRGYSLKTDVLKVGHHGSDTSTTESFLSAVGPKYAVISCGVQNQYDHPNDETLNKLNTKNIEIFRTDLDGTIVASSDGENITFDKKGATVKGGGSSSSTSTASSSEKSPEESPEKSAEVKAPETDHIAEVYITNTGSKYHKGSCSSLSKSKHPISLDKAKESYEPCKRCKP